jgi:hypothetical protein
MSSASSLRRNDLVEVKTPAEILATLDENGKTDGLSFMPEMAACCGRRFVVDRRGDKICDSNQYTGSRRLPDSVLLTGLRCTGNEHGGCQAECRVFWKESWLRKVDPDSPLVEPASNESMQLLLERTRANARHMVNRDGQQLERWACQATEMFQATNHLKVYDPRPYIGQYLNGNVSLGKCVRISMRAFVEEPFRRIGLASKVVKGVAEPKKPGEPLNLQPGDWVRVRPEEEIRQTLTLGGFNRGLWFDREFLQYCGKVFQVRRRIERLIDESRDIGRMIELKSDAVTLEGAWCTGDVSQRQWFCPRNAMAYWRECWLERVDPPASEKQD